MKKLAIMKDVGYGCRDTNGVCLWFDTYVTEGTAALQVLFNPEADKVIRASGVYNVRELEGKPCWVEDNQGMIHFLEVAKI